MAPFDELRVLQVAEGIADEMWHQVMSWQSFARDVVGGQLCRAVDSIGKNTNAIESDEMLFEKEHLHWLQNVTEPDLQQLTTWGVTITDDSPITNNQ